MAVPPCATSCVIPVPLRLSRLRTRAVFAWCASSARRSTKLDPGEDPLDAAHRELAEETGMQAEKMAYLTTIATSDGFCDELIHLYMATDLSYHQSSPDADEFINVDLVDLSELVDAVLDGRIEDAKTVVGALICDAIAHRLAPGEAAGPVNDPAGEGELDG